MMSGPVLIKGQALGLGGSLCCKAIGELYGRGDIVDDMDLQYCCVVIINYMGLCVGV